MPRSLARIVLSVVALGAVALTACQTSRPEHDDAMVSTSPVTDSRTTTLMYRKLMHSHAILDGLPGRRFDLIESNAEALVNLSTESDWFVHDTVAYTAFSSQFRDAARALADRAADEDLSGCSDAYATVVRECVACHEYLRTEGLLRDAPGRISDAGASADLLLSLALDGS